MDLRIAKTFRINERVSVLGLFEFFNLFNSANPAAVNFNQNHSPRLPGEPVSAPFRNSCLAAKASSGCVSNSELNQRTER